MDPLFAWLESTAFSVWMREDPSILAFPAVLAMHTIGLGLVVGISVVVDLRLLGVAHAVPLMELRRFVPVFWIGLGLNAASGVALLIAYPTKALTDPVFYVKLGCIAAALALWFRIRRALIDHTHPGWTAARARTLAVASLVCWAAAITAGRLLAYTYRRLTVDF